MNHRSHRNLAKLLSPNSSWKMIDGVNSIIDNPNQQSVAFNHIFQRYEPDSKSGKMGIVNPFDYYDLGKTAPHRRVNHDVLSATAMSYLGYGIEGAKLGNLHCLVDVLGEQIKKEQGVTGRDLFEAHMNHLLENHVLPTIIRNQKMRSIVANNAYNNVKRSYSRKPSRNSKTGRMHHRQNLHRTFIPTKSFYH